MMSEDLVMKYAIEGIDEVASCKESNTTCATNIVNPWEDPFVW